MKKVPDEMIRFIDTHSRFAIIGHKEPDGDCVGSQLALGSFLQRRGKAVALCSAGPFNRVEIKQYSVRFSPQIPADFKPDAVIVVDCSNVSRIGNVSIPSNADIAFIDHHEAGSEHLGTAYIDPKAPAVTYMVAKVIEAFGDKADPGEAQAMLFGLCTDTGFFRHLTDKSADVFRIVSHLVDAGASPKKAFVEMYGGRSLLSRKLLARIIDRADSYFDGRLILSTITLDDKDKYGDESRDSDMLYQLLQNVAGCQAVVIIRQENPGECTVGFRSREPIDVGSVAARLGGGGHRLAAGLLLPGRVEEVRDIILSEFEHVF
jgi:phosphoesterase RecJ-like protein